MSIKEDLLNVLNSELIPAMGCTEPIAIVFAAAKARDVLGCFPDKIRLSGSGSIFKNAKGVFIPNTNGLTGVKISAVLGAITGGSEKDLEVIENVTPEVVERAKNLCLGDFCETVLLDTVKEIIIIAEAWAGKDKVYVEIEDTHTNVTKVMKNDEIIFEKPAEEKSIYDFSGVSFDEIYKFANEIEISLVKDIIARQIKYNMRSAEEGMNNKQELNLGRALLEKSAEDPLEKGIAFAGAACDARMSGASVPACSIGGSGSQGITASVPIYIYCREKDIHEEKMIRAIVLSDLTYLYIKKGIGRLAAYCSAVVSSAAVGGAIMYLEYGDIEYVKRAVINTLANVSGVLCDGAKLSCALKVVAALKAASVSVTLAAYGHNIDYDTGILGKDFEKSIRNVGFVASTGMDPTNKKIISLMYNEK